MKTNFWSVPEWLIYCEKNQIDPWSYDFKQSYLQDEISHSKYKKSPLKLILAYKSGLLKDNNNNYNFSHKAGTNADCDKEVLPIYNILRWQNDPSDQIRGETLNTFNTTFNSLLSINRSPFNYENINTWKQILGLTNKSDIPKLNYLLKRWVSNENINQEIQKFPFYRKSKDANIFLLDEIKKFASLTHTIGNFSVIPTWMNQGKGVGNIRDYLDLTLRDSRNLILEIDEISGKEFWKKFVNKYYLQPFLHPDYSVAELWDGHFDSSVMPQSIIDFNQFYHNVNVLIEERGKWITKELYDNLELNESSYYQKELSDMDRIKFFDEIMKYDGGN